MVLALRTATFVAVDTVRRGGSGDRRRGRARGAADGSLPAGAERPRRQEVAAEPVSAPVVRGWGVSLSRTGGLRVLRGASPPYRLRGSLPPGGLALPVRPVGRAGAEGGRECRGRSRQLPFSCRPGASRSGTRPSAARPGPAPSCPWASPVSSSSQRRYVRRPPPGPALLFPPSEGAAGTGTLLGDGTRPRLFRQLPLTGVPVLLCTLFPRSPRTPISARSTT